MNDEQFEQEQLDRDNAYKQALARVEAERDEMRDWLFARAIVARDTAQTQLAEAVGLLREVEPARYFADELDARVEAFLARHAQAEQQEAQSPMAKIAEGLRQKAADEWANHPSNPANEEAQGAQAGDDPKIPPMGKLDIPACGVPLNECHSCGWVGGENEVPGEEDQCYCPNCHSDNIDDDVNLPRLFHLVRYLARAALATQPAAAEPLAWIIESPEGCAPCKSINTLKHMAERYAAAGWSVTPLYASPPAAAHGDEAVLWELLEELRTATDRQALPGEFIRVMWEAGCDWINARAAMRAQGDAESV